MEHQGEFTTTEAAYLATACLAADAESAMSPEEMLLQAAIAGPTGAALVTERAVNKAIEEDVVSPARATRTKLDEGVVLYLVSARRLAGVRLSREAKTRLYGALRDWRGRGSRTWRWEIAPALYFTPGRDLGRWHLLLRTYVRDRDRYIVRDPEIMGGTPVIRGTRISVYSVLARLAGGDGIEDLIADYPEVPRAAFEAAAVHARTHPRRGRPARRLR
jgi:uncharacterized protein (DUF433 family)